MTATNTENKPCSKDVCFVVEGREIFASRNLLAVWSSVFEKLLYGNMKEKDETRIHLPDEKYEEFNCLMNFIHPPTSSAVPKVEQKNLEILVRLADKYDMPGVMYHCEGYMIRMADGSDSEKIECLFVADKYKCKRALEKLLYPVSLAQCSLFETAKFSELSKDTLCKLLQMMVEKQRETGLKFKFDRYEYHCSSLHPVWYVKEMLCYHYNCFSSEWNLEFESCGNGYKAELLLKNRSEKRML